MAEPKFNLYVCKTAIDIAMNNSDVLEKYQKIEKNNGATADAITSQYDGLKDHMLLFMVKLSWKKRQPGANYDVADLVVKLKHFKHYSDWIWQVYDIDIVKSDN